MEDAPANDANLAMLTRVALALGELRDSLVFVGGCSTGLLVTAASAQMIRPTRDVDLIAEVASARDYHALEAQLTAKGFRHDDSDGAPICRWVHDDVTVDLLPSEPGVLGFHNRWYPLAVQTALRVKLPAGIMVRLISAAAFVATKLEAFKGRGKHDFLVSHDLEDIVTVVIGRHAILEEVRQSAAELQQYLAAELSALLSADEFLDALAAHLPGDVASQQRLPVLIGRLRAIARMQKP